MNYTEFCFQIATYAKRIIAPSLRYHGDIYDQYLYKFCNQGKWLDLGCGTLLLSPWRKCKEEPLISQSDLVVGLDISMGSLRKNMSLTNLILGDISNLPFSDNTFHRVTSNMVFEHLREPEKQLAEIFRILKPGGLLIFATPNSLGYTTIFGRFLPDILKKALVKVLEGRDEDDVFPAYYRINTEREIKKFARLTGYDICEIRYLSTYPKFIVVPPLAIIEFCFTRLMMSNYLKKIRPYLIVILKKPVV